ncbi:hypothetical protein MA16_Dca003187 [Dendrobium catenatum]|uniref:Uncharacterized protein n=1 Tax=Dendrobium catenatum TaxID=906689 RepID=A0A2I0XBY8_9ASPA|nr:hypothetical protein MA16_Dca003187 [Dendrobium catenatum]
MQRKLKEGNTPSAHQLIYTLNSYTVQIGYICRQVLRHPLLSSDYISVIPTMKGYPNKIYKVDD